MGTGGSTVAAAVAVRERFRRGAAAADPHALLALPRDVVGRVRGLFLLFALINATVIPIALIWGGSASIVDRSLVGAGTVWLVWWWVRGFRRGRFPVWGEPLEAAALLGVASGLGQPTFLLSLLYVGVLFRSLYGSLPVNILRACAYLGAYAVAMSVSPELPGGLLAAALAQLPGFSMVALLMHVLSRALSEHALLSARERVLADAGAAFVGAETRADLHQVVLDSARDLGAREVALLQVAGDVMEVVAVGARSARVGVRFAADVLWPAPPDAPRPVALEAAASARVRRAVGLPSAVVPALALPVVINGRLRVVLVGWGRDVAEPDAVEAFDHLGHAIALAFERVGLAEGLRASEERFRSLVQNASDVISVVDADSTVLYLTPSVERMLGHEPDELLGRRLTDLVHPDELPDAIAFFVRAPEMPGSTPPVKWQLRHRDGSWRHVELVGANLLGDPNVGGLVLTARDVTERTELEAQLIRQAFHDGLTGLANRMLFTDRVEHGLARAHRAGEAVAVLMLDLDDFKGINDTLGHAAGDELLVAVAERLRHCVRPGDTIARLGGDEFAVLLEGVTTMEDAPRVAERILDALDSPLLAAQQDVFVHASIGLAVSSHGGERVDELLRMADVALYIAKGRGKDRFEVFEPSMHTAALQHRRMKSELQRAVAAADDEFLIHYQPTCQLESGALLGFEALVRWRHPEWGLVGPDRFIGAAEENGTIVAVGERVLRTACAQVRRWQDSYPLTGPLTLAVNVASRQLQEDGFVDAVAAVLADTGLDASYLTLEITEHALMADTPATMERLLALKGLGVSLAIDDFGVGYSSLSYLRRFPIDILKIDRAFTDGAAGSNEESALARAIVRLAEALHLKTVAEGIERQEQVDALLSMGCTVGQGYLFAPPLEVPDVEQLLGGVVVLGGPTPSADPA